MKEKDLGKMLDSMIIDGLIKEAEQDNADFEYAMGKISEEDFDGIIGVPKRDGASKRASGRVTERKRIRDVSYPRFSLVPEKEEQDAKRRQPKKKRYAFKPWLYSLSAAAAILVGVIVPSYNIMNNKLCDSALIASSQFMTPTKGGFDVSNASADQIEKQLPFLERNYAQAADDEEMREAGWTLTVAYLKLHKKTDAVKVLEELNTKFGANRTVESANPYQELLDILD